VISAAKQFVRTAFQNPIGYVKAARFCPRHCMQGHQKHCSYNNPPPSEVIRVCALAHPDLAIEIVANRRARCACLEEFVLRLHAGGKSFRTRIVPSGEWTGWLGFALRITTPSARASVFITEWRGSVRRTQTYRQHAPRSQQKLGRESMSERRKNKNGRRCTNSPEREM